MLKVVLALGLTASVLALASCGSQSSPTSTPSGTSSGVRGIVLFSGGPYIASSSPLPDGFGTTKLGRPYPWVTVEVRVKTGPGAGQVVAKVKPDAQALFTISLPAGTYVLAPLVPKNGPFPMPTTIVVEPGRYARTIVRVSGP
jgi:hypothetical protein